MSGTRVALLCGAVVVAACSSSGSSSSPTSSFFVDGPPAVETAARSVPDAADDAAIVVLGTGIDEELAITQCTRGSLGALDGSGATEVLLNLVARGTKGDDIPVTITVRRFAAPGEVLTITDTVTYAEGPDDAPTLVLQAQRFEVSGAVTDARDPAAVGALVSDDGDLVTVDGIFGPPGAFAGDAGLVGGSIAARCEAAGS